MILDYPEINWNYPFLSKSSKMTWKTVFYSQDKNWNFEHLSANKMTLSTEKYIQNRLNNDEFL